jgi:hypothetical protein
MILTFENGTDLQQEIVRTTVHVLMGLPFDSINLDWTIEFTPDPDPSLHNEFAVTNWSYDSNVATTEIASVAPNWPYPWTGPRFMQETVAHELGHALFASLSEANRQAIAAMFGAASDDPEILAPPGSAWEDRIQEGIAETFKDAFLPRRYRSYSNRTNHKISYSRFPEFRALWRTATVEAGGEELPEGETAVPAYDEDIFAVGHTQVAIGPPAEDLLIPGEGKDGIWETLFTNMIFNLGHNGQLRSASKFEGWVKDGTVLNYSFTIRPEYFLDAPYVDPEIFPKYQDFRLIWEIFKATIPGAALAEYTKLRAAEWAKTLDPGEFTGEYSGGYVMRGLAEGHGPPPVLFSNSITVDASLFPLTRLCRGQLYRFVALRAQPVVILTLQHPMTEAEGKRLRNEAAYPWFPELHFSQSACPTPADPIVIPSGLLSPGGAHAGVVPSRNRISGARL